jgi:hypothetical protein
MPDEQKAEDRAPYLSLTTLTNFLDKLGAGAIPPRIDKSAIDTYSGGTQSLLISTLKLMGYIDEDGRVLPQLRESAIDLDARKAWLQGWARQFYKEQLSLAEQNATPQMLHESFAAHKYSGSTLRKAIVFYLTLVDYLGLPNSPLFRAPKQSATPTSRRRPPSQAAKRALAKVTPTPPAPLATSTGRGEVTVIKIGALATVTITVDAQWMRLSVDTIMKMREAIADLEALGTVDQEEP